MGVTIVRELTAPAPAFTICARPSLIDDSMNDSSPTAWWAHHPTLLRLVSDLLAAELAQARPGRPPAPPPWPGGLDFVRDLGADSLELLGMGTTLAEALHLRFHDGELDARLLARPVLEEWVAAARAGLAAGAQAITFRTSGSAGTPKRCTHTLATLWQETRVLAGLLPARRRILSAVPSHHIYGFLFTVLLPRTQEINEVIDLRAASPAAWLDMLRPGDLVVAHPGWWEALACLRPAFAADITGVSSTAPCPDALADELAAAGLRLLQVYGSSETAGVGWRERGGVPFTLFPYWEETEDASALLRRLPDGSQVRYSLQDKLEWAEPEEDGARRFSPAGRIDAAVQVGGTNVFPGYVAEVLRMHPAVADAAVRLMRADEGRRLKAYVVPCTPADDGGAGLRADLAAWIGARLAPAERPAAWTFGSRLPRQASGKPADWIIDSDEAG
jgi:4-coumarate--CoA ligase (photoactive yellow protein activation family)